jgi:hypothetical protein
LNALLLNNLPGLLQPVILSAAEVIISRLPFFFRWRILEGQLIIIVVVFIVVI